MSITLFHADLIVREHLYKPLPATVHLLGRQTILFDEETALKLLKRYGIAPVKTEAVLDIATIGAQAMGGRGYITDTTFFRMLSVKEVKAIDHSDYEGAEIIVDLNRPLPDALADSADFIFGGSVLDNIFDPATYIKNITRLLKEGGRLIDHNTYGFHSHPYLLASPAWYYDYYVMNRFADCKIYFIEVSSITQVYALNVETDDSIICDFGSASLANRCDIVVIAEKGAQSSWNEVPSQDQYRGEEEWSRYRANLVALKKSPRPQLAFNSPSPAQLEKHPLRRIKSLPYLGCYIPFAPNDYVPGKDPMQAAAPKTGIRVIEATYGWNIQRADIKTPGVFPLCRGNVTEKLAHLMDGNDGAQIVLNVELMGDPAPGLGKDLHVTYYYANDPERRLRDIYIAAEAHGHALTIPPFNVARKGKKVA
jgi:SAM-dependent methyltransferase